MDKAEGKQIADFLIEVREDICEGDGDAALRLHLTELYRVIKRLMAATYATQDQGLKVLLAMMEKRARECQQQIGDSVAGPEMEEKALAEVEGGSEGPRGLADSVIPVQEGLIWSELSSSTWCHRHPDSPSGDRVCREP